MAIIREYRPKLDDAGLMLMAESGMYRNASRRITNTMTAASIVADTFGLRTDAEEVFLCMCLNAHGDIIGMFKNSTGCADMCSTGIREFCKKVLLLNASSVIVAHNHPGGTCSASQEDIALTDTIKRALDVLGIRFLDHIIIPAFSNGYFSFAEEHLI